jgi:anti-sigma28 factor (negative regulator of flagellin synthesis)
MRINDNNSMSGLTGTGVGGPDRTRGTEGVQSSLGGRIEQRSQDGDRVQLSGLSSALRTETEDTPERLEKVAQLRTAIQSGAYHPDPRAVGSRIIDDALGRSGGIA